MDLARKIEVLDGQVTAAKNGQPDDFEGWRASTEVTLRTVMGDQSPLLAQFQGVHYSPQVWFSGMDSSGYRPAGVKRVIAILEAAKRELTLRAELEQVVETEESAQEKAIAAEQGRVFIVHGHDEARKHELFRVLHDITGTKPIILHEQPSGGRGILEKLEAYAASVGFAVALLTADDLGGAKESDDEAPRARQNVVFEAGYFAGRLGRARVVLLYESGVELPSDLDGIVYVPLDPAGAWKMKVAHEMANEGLKVDWSGLAGQ
jgi:predicted nucleotide-binding protein